MTYKAKYVTKRKNVTNDTLCVQLMKLSANCPQTQKLISQIVAKKQQSKN